MCSSLPGHRDVGAWMLQACGAFLLYKFQPRPELNVITIFAEMHDVIEILAIQLISPILCVFTKSLKFSVGWIWLR